MTQRKRSDGLDRLAQEQTPEGTVSYTYVEGNPINFTDPLGLSKTDKWFGYGGPEHKGFRDWWHQEKKFWGNEDIPNQEVCDNLYKDYLDLKARGESSGKGRKSGKGGQSKGDQLKRIMRRGGGGRGGE